MSVYVYEGYNARGIKCSDSLEAGSRETAVKLLQEQGIVPLSVRRRYKPWRHISLGQHNPAAFRVNFCRQMASMLRAGIPILEAAQVFSQGSSTVLQRKLSKLITGLERGYSLAEAMGQAENMFTDFMIGVVRTGEISGNIAETLQRLYEILEKQRKMREKLKNAMLYPLFLCCLSMVMAGFLLQQVIPVFAEIFAGFEAQLPWTTLLLLQIKDNLQLYLLLIACACLLLTLSWKGLHKIQGIGIRLDRLVLRIPVFGSLRLKSEQAVFFSTLGLLVRSGIRVNYGMELLKNMCSNMFLKFFYISMLRQLEQGYALSTCMSKGKIYKPMVLTMITAGERTGELAEMLENAGTICQEEADLLAERINILAEPVIIVALGIIIGFIVLSTVLPVLDLMTVM